MLLVATLVLSLVVVVLVLTVAAQRRPADEPEPDDLDPLLIPGIAVTGAGVALAVTIGPIMALMVGAGLVLLGVAALRTLHRRR